MKRTPKTPVSPNLVKDVMGLVNACNATEPALPEHARARLQTKVQAQHTPTPWIATVPPSSCLTVRHITAPCGVNIAEIGRRDYGTGDIREDVANAEFICRAVNSHADLLAALRACADFLHAWAQNPVATKSNRFDAFRQQAEFARAAIAKAEKG